MIIGAALGSAVASVSETALVSIAALDGVVVLVGGAALGSPVPLTSRAALVSGAALKNAVALERNAVSVNTVDLERNAALDGVVVLVSGSVLAKRAVLKAGVLKVESTSRAIGLAANVEKRISSATVTGKCMYAQDVGFRHLMSLSSALRKHTEAQSMRKSISLRSSLRKSC